MSLKVLEAEPRTAPESPRASKKPPSSKIQPNPLLILPHAMRVSDVVPTDAPPDAEVWMTAIFRIWAPGTAKNCRLCPREACKTYNIGLVEACSVGVDGYVASEELEGLLSHDELFTAGPQSVPRAADEAGAGAPPPRLRILQACRPDGD